MREALELLRRALDGDTPAEGALVDLEDVLQGALDDARSILGTENERDGRDRPRPGFLFATVLTGHSGKGESFAEKGDNGLMQTDVCGTTKEARTVGSIEGRLRRLEERGRGAPCPECNLPPDGHGYLVLIDEEHPEKSFDGDPDERCGRCGRFLYTVIQVVYDEEGGGA